MLSRTRQPAGEVRVAPRGPFARGMVGALYSDRYARGHSAIGPVRGDSSYYTAEPFSAYYRGHRYACPAASSTSYGWGAYTARTMGSNPQNPQAMSIAALCSFRTYGSGNVYLTNAPGGGFDCIAINTAQGAGTNEFGASMRAGSGTYYAVASGDTAVEKVRFAVVRVRANGNLELWSDGVLIGQTATSLGGFGLFYTNTDWFSCYVQRDVRLFVGYAWNRWITDSEIAALTADPFAAIYAGDPLDGMVLGATSQFARPIADVSSTNWVIA